MKRFRFVMIASVLVVACGRGPEVPSAVPTTPRSPTVGAPAADVPPRHVSVLLRADCAAASMAEKVSLRLDAAKLSDALSVLSMFSGARIRVEGFDDAGVLLSVDAAEHPWDCLIDDLAASLSLQRRMVDGEIVLSPKDENRDDTK